MVAIASALIAAIAALFAAAVAFSGFLIAKDLKTTEFRQSWINGQRDDLSTLIAEAQAISRLTSDRQCRLRKFDRAAARISLRENPIKREWQLPLRCISQLRGFLITSSIPLEQIAPLINSLTEQAQMLLKTEWDRVRAGEDSYQRSKSIVFWGGVGAGLLVVCLLCAIGYGKGFIIIGEISNISSIKGTAGSLTQK